MTVSTDLYLYRDSIIHKIDPRVKLIFVFAAFLVLLLNQNALLMLAALILLHLLHLVAKMPLEKLRFIWKSLWFVAIIMFILRTLFYPGGTVLWRFGIVQVTTGGLAEGMALGLRILAMAFAVFLWLYTTDQPSLIRSFVRLRMPYNWALVLALALRYIPTFQATFGMIEDAQQARGLDIAGSKGFRRVQQMVPIFVSMIIVSLRASSQTAMALEARGFGLTDVPRTTLVDIHFRQTDFLLTVVILFSFLLFLYFYLVYGFGGENWTLWP
jgi:energy-coupling factor transport system permease protein